MRPFVYAFLVAGLLVLLAGCDSNNDDESGVVMLTGQVLNDETNNPVDGAFVRVQPPGILAETDEQGRYAISDIEVDSTTQLQLTATKDGFSSATTTVIAVAGRDIEAPVLRIRPTSEERPESGSASNILLLEQSAQSIGVKESGSEEVAQITFQATDSLGRPVILDNAVEMRFTLGQRPSGGEFIFPDVVTTDNNGQATVNLSSGTRAGVVQIVAEAEVDGRTIRSLPVSVAIHGGLPDQRHFSVGPERFNFPGLVTYGLTDPISVIVGDRWSNPVKPGTAVYFETSHGVIEGSVLTNEQGRGSVNLISANPAPPDGIAVVTATTADSAQQAVSGRTAVVFSGVSFVTVTPGTARLNETYRVTVQDGNANPLAPGSSLSVRVEGTKVKAVGNTNVRIEDTAFYDQNGDGDALDYEDVRRGPGVTEFTFRAVEDLNLDETGSPTVETITITLSSPNGSIELVLGGGAPATTTRGARLQTRGDGSLEATLER
jgi:hypothetical protein